MLKLSSPFKMTYEDNYRRYQPKRDIQPSSYKYTPSPVRNLSQPSVHVGVHVKLRTSQSPSNVQRVPISIESRDRMTQNSPFNKDRHMHRSCEFLSEPNFDYEPHPFQRQSNLHHSRDHSPIFHSTTPFRYKSPNLQASHVEVKHSFMPPSHSSNEPCCSSKINQRFTTHHNESTYNESSVYTTSSFEERYRTNVCPETTTIPNKRQNNNCVKVIKINKTISDTNEKIEKKKKKNVTQTSPYQPNEDAKEVFHFTVESSDIDD